MTAKDQWILLQAVLGRDEVEAVLSRHFHTLPVEQRVKLQLAKAQFEFVIEQILEQSTERWYGAMA
jgi:hypothetical protein